MDKESTKKVIHGKEERISLKEKVIKEYLNHPSKTIRQLAEEFHLNRTDISLWLKEKHGEKLIKKRKTAKFYTSEEKEEFVTSYFSHANITIAEFARKNNLPCTTFSKWVYKSRKSMFPEVTWRRGRIYSEKEREKYLSLYEKEYKGRITRFCKIYNIPKATFMSWVEKRSYNLKNAKSVPTVIKTEKNKDLLSTRNEYQINSNPSMSSLTKVSPPDDLLRLLETDSQIENSIQSLDLNNASSEELLRMVEAVPQIENPIQSLDLNNASSEELLRMVEAVPQIENPIQSLDLNNASSEELLRMEETDPKMENPIQLLDLNNASSEELLRMEETDPKMENPIQLLDLKNDSLEELLRMLEIVPQIENPIQSLDLNNDSSEELLRMVETVPQIGQTANSILLDKKKRKQDDLDSSEIEQIVKKKSIAEQTTKKNNENRNFNLLKIENKHECSLVNLAKRENQKRPSFLTKKNYIPILPNSPNIFIFNGPIIFLDKESELTKVTIEGNTNDRLEERAHTMNQFPKQLSSLSHKILIAKAIGEEQLEQENNLPKTMDKKLYKSKKYRNDR